MPEPLSNDQPEATESPSSPIKYDVGHDPRLRYIPPYWHAYATMAKGRWWDRPLLELISTEFRDRSLEYYAAALRAGVCTLNGRPASAETVVRNGDRLRNIVHRHEPPVTREPVRVVSVDKENEVVVVEKSGGVPVHATGRYFHNSLVQILKEDFGFEKIYTVNRLDRLTSGLMLLALTPTRARTLCAEFAANAIRKEYLARCTGHFPAEELTVDQPLLNVDRQMGLVIVHPLGKEARTTFRRLFYDAESDTSVLHCRPLTGRTHQIRVHLQYLGHPIANDPIYGTLPRWGKGGIDLTPAVALTPSVMPAEAALALGKRAGVIDGMIVEADGNGDEAVPPEARKLLPRETGEDIGMNSPVALSAEAVRVIKRLRDAKDKDEDWGRWRDIVFKAEGAKIMLPPSSLVQSLSGGGTSSTYDPRRDGTTFTPARHADTGTLYCPECFVPLHPDPKPERMYIFLHALRYGTSVGEWESAGPEWAGEGWRREGREEWVGGMREQQNGVGVDLVEGGELGRVTDGIEKLQMRENKNNGTALAAEECGLT